MHYADWFHWEPEELLLLRSSLRVPESWSPCGVSISAISIVAVEGLPVDDLACCRRIRSISDGFVADSSTILVQ